jgi:hypothetical protein
MTTVAIFSDCNVYASGSRWRSRMRFRAAVLAQLVAQKIRFGIELRWRGLEGASLEAGLIVAERT